jgi:hypothetical protein
MNLARVNKVVLTNHALSRLESRFKGKKAKKFRKDIFYAVKHGDYHTIDEDGICKFYIKLDYGYCIASKCDRCESNLVVITYIHDKEIPRRIWDKTYEGW